MRFYEIEAAMKYSYYAGKDGWEQTRLIAYLIAQTNSTKTLKLTDIMKFHWEEVGDTAISNADIERLRKKAETYNKG